MRPFGLTWVACQIVRVVGFLVMAFAIYSFIPGVPFPVLVADTPRWLFGLMSFGYGVLIVTAAESWLVWFQTERNTAEIANRLRRIEHLLERDDLSTQGLSQQEIIRREIL